MAVSKLTEKEVADADQVLRQIIAELGSRGHEVRFDGAAQDGMFFRVINSDTPAQQYTLAQLWEKWLGG